VADIGLAVSESGAGADACRRSALG
jgi:hypothetical protein